MHIFDRSISVYSFSGSSMYFLLHMQISVVNDLFKPATPSTSSIFFLTPTASAPKYSSHWHTLYTLTNSLLGVMLQSTSIHVHIFWLMSQVPQNSVLKKYLSLQVSLQPQMHKSRTEMQQALQSRMRQAHFLIPSITTVEPICGPDGQLHGSNRPVQACVCWESSVSKQDVFWADGLHWHI